MLDDYFADGQASDIDYHYFDAIAFSISFDYSIRCFGGSNSTLMLTT